MRITRKKTTMKFKVTTCFIALTLALTAGAVSVSASSERKGDLRVTKECSAHTGLAGQFCMVLRLALPSG